MTQTALSSVAATCSHFISSLSVSLFCVPLASNVFVLISSLLSTLLCFAVYFLYLSILILSISVRCLYSFMQLYFFPVFFPVLPFLLFALIFKRLPIFICYLPIRLFLPLRICSLPLHLLLTYHPFSASAFSALFTSLFCLCPLLIFIYLYTFTSFYTFSVLSLPVFLCQPISTHNHTVHNACHKPITSTFPLFVIFNILSNHLTTTAGSSPLSYKHQTA